MNLAKESNPPLTLTIDKFGRVVIPREVREALHMKAGTKLEVALETDSSIVLKVIYEEPEIEYRNGWPTIKGPADFDIVETIKEERERRSRKIWDPTK